MMIQDHKVTKFYTAPTAIRSLIKAAERTTGAPGSLRPDEPPQVLGTVGEPINRGGLGVVPQAHRRRPLPDRRHLLADRDRRPHDHAAARRDAAGAGLVHAAGSPASRQPWSTRWATTCRTCTGGLLVIKKPWPAMIRTIWGDPERFEKSYYPPELKGYYLAATARSATRRPATSRSPAASTTCSTSRGHRMGTMEIESALVSHTELVAEAAVVGRPDDTTGEAICAFVVLKRAAPDRRGGEEDRQRAAQLGRQGDRPIAKPKDIRFGDNLPKTRSGKIMRRLLRSIAAGEAITQDTSTLENPAVLDQLPKTDLDGPRASTADTRRSAMEADLTTRVVRDHEIPGAEVQALALRLVARVGDDESCITCFILLVAFDKPFLASVWAKASPPSALPTGWASSIFYGSP
jgi:acetyl-CoA synthetase